MRIGIDLDDTTFILVDTLLRYADYYNEKVLRKEPRTILTDDLTTHKYLQILYDWNEEIKFAFFDNYYAKILEECPVLPDVVEVLRSWKEKGHEIYFVSSRLMGVENCNTEQITKNALKKAGISYERLMIGLKDKKEACLTNKIQYFIDDSYEICKELQEAGIKTYWMTSPINQKRKENDVEKVKNWKDLKEKIGF